MAKRITRELPVVERGKHDKDQRQHCLIEAATRVFAENGFDAATTREIAERAGCSEGLIHRYFGGKRGLLIAILDQKSETILSDRAVEMPVQPTLEAEIEQLLVWPLLRYWEQRDFMRVSVSQAAIDPAVGRTIGDRVNHAHVAFIGERLREHRAAGNTRDGIDLDAIAMSISGLNIAMGFFAQVAFAMHRTEIERYAIETARVIARGLAPDRAAKPVTFARAGSRAVATPTTRRTAVHAAPPAEEKTDAE